MAAAALACASAPKCMQLAIKKAKQHGIGMVCVRNSTHYGFAGYYPLMAENSGCIGISGTNARPSIAPTYGVEPMMGTNPIVFGMPSTDAFPFVLDCATSVNQRGKIEKYESFRNGNVILGSPYKIHESPPAPDRHCHCACRLQATGTVAVVLWCYHMRSIYILLQ